MGERMTGVRVGASLGLEDSFGRVGIGGATGVVERICVWAGSPVRKGFVTCGICRGPGPVARIFRVGIDLALWVRGLVGGFTAGDEDGEEHACFRWTTRTDLAEPLHHEVHCHFQDGVCEWPMQNAAQDVDTAGMMIAFVRRGELEGMTGG